MDIFVDISPRYVEVFHPTALTGDGDHLVLVVAFFEVVGILVHRNWEWFHGLKEVILGINLELS